MGKKRSKRILFYSSVADKSLFEIQRFYKIDIELLRELGHEIQLSNCIGDALKFWSYDAAFIYFYKYGFFVALIARMFFKRVYFTGGLDELDEDFAGVSKYKRQSLFFRMCRALATSCIVVSKADEKNIEKLYGGKRPSKLSFSEHTIDTKNFDRACPKENLFSSIAWMGDRMNVERKGLDKSLRLFAYLCGKPEFSDASLMIIGRTGPGSDALKQQARELGLTAEQVVFTGAVDEEEKISILSRSRYYLQLSRYEGFGIAAVEALAAGCTVIHSAKGGLRDTMHDWGIIFDINASENEEFEKIFVLLQTQNRGSAPSGKRYVSQRFANDRRLSDLSRIIK